MRTALFGGTFDPIHNAHVAVARSCLKKLELDRVLMIPAANPPHKAHERTAAFEHRYRMVELACETEPGLVPSLLEAGAERSYSIATIEKVICDISLTKPLYFLIGADAFDDLTTWHRWKDVSAAVEFVVVSRPGHLFQIPEGVVLHSLETIPMDVSSSVIREQLARGEHPDSLPPAVFNYIAAHGLYDYREERVKKDS